MFIDLNHPQPPVVVGVQDGLDAGGLPRPGVSVKENVIRAPPLYKSLGVFDQFFLLRFITDQIIQGHFPGAPNRQNQRPVLLRAVADPKGLVQSKLSDPVPFVEGGHNRKHFFRILCLFQLSG